MPGYLLPSMGTVLKESYFDLKSWYNNPCRFSSSTPYGKLEVAGRYISVSAAHLANACLSLTVGLVYDTALAVLFFSLNTLTASRSDFIYRNYVHFGFNATTITPTAVLGHALAAVSPPFIYTCDSQIVERFSRTPSEEMVNEGFTELIAIAVNSFLVYAFLDSLYRDVRDL